MRSTTPTQISSLYGPTAGIADATAAVPGRDLDGDGDHVVDQQRHRADLRDARAEVLPRHDVRAARPDVDHDDLAVGEHHERHHQQDDQRQRQDQRERRQAGDRQQRDEDLLGAVRRRGDAVRRQHAERQRLGQPLLAELLVDERRPEQPLSSPCTRGRASWLPRSSSSPAGLAMATIRAFRRENVPVTSYHPLRTSQAREVTEPGRGTQSTSRSPSHGTVINMTSTSPASPPPTVERR